MNATIGNAIALVIVSALLAACLQSHGGKGAMGRERLLVGLVSSFPASISHRRVFLAKAGVVGEGDRLLHAVSIVWIGGEASPLWLAGIVILCLLAVPAVAVSALSGWFAARRRARDRCA